MKNKRKICIMGMGYIGLPTAALLANRGYQVYGVDINQHVIDTINRGQILEKIWGGEKLKTLFMIRKH